VVAQFVEHYNTVRLHSAIGYLAPKDKLEGRTEMIWQARERRRQKRAEIDLSTPTNPACN